MDTRATSFFCYSPSKFADSLYTKQTLATEKKKTRRSTLQTGNLGGEKIEIALYALPRESRLTAAAVRLGQMKKKKEKNIDSPEG